MERAIVKSAIALRMPSEAATKADLPLAHDLLDTLVAHVHECVGLAANMVGARKRVIAFDNNGTPMAMLNPTIVDAQAPYQTEEGCLSLPGTRPCTRYRRIRVRYQDLQLHWHEDAFSGFVAQIIQHEVDHCNGIVI